MMSADSPEGLSLDPDAKCPQAYFDITVQPFSQSWYIPTGRGGSYQAGIGIRTPDGSYLKSPVPISLHPGEA